MFLRPNIIPFQLGENFVIALVQQQLLAVLLKALAFVLGQIGGGVGAKSQLVDENDHLLPGLTEIIDPLHKVKGKLQRVPGGSHGVLPAAHLGIELGPHGVKGILGIQGFVQLFAPGVQQGGGADAGGQFLGQQAGGGFGFLQPLAVALALLRKQGGRPGLGLLVQRPLKTA